MISLKPFVDCCHAVERNNEVDGNITSFVEAGNTETRWRCFSRDWIKIQKGDSLDIAWLKNQNSVDTASLQEPDILAAEAMSKLTEALRELNGLMLTLGASDQAKVN